MHDVHVFQVGPDFKPYPGRIKTQHIPPMNAMVAGRPMATGQPYVSAIQGVNVGERVTPRSASVFIRPLDF